jgi:hypothetical protein
MDHGTRIGGYTVRFAQQDGADPETAIATATKAGQTLDGASFHSPVAAGCIANVFQTNLGSPPTGAAVGLALSVGGATSNTVTIAIQ